MRISDWSSDVCSSDLATMFGGNRLEKMRGIRKRKMRQNGPRHVDGSEVIGWRVETNAELTNERIRSEEHTSELQSLMRISYAVFCLKKKKQTTKTHIKKLQSNKQQQYDQTQPY